ncbi:hypothetical protein QH639_19455 [Lysinibacillus sp. 1 U-2021]|uniref:hypothetical protein n=1 Tax=Lysinibacillus sp. 1 U-2021 TaxID=3039426 RepID=UPI00247FF53D|nr:hypothetical protein [Lysinibacillus sp. 1 U-2021]WGT37981.1 hypothetical protein QH639_19455 [Lysinibacillus sp. 1 U-2021]
MNTTFDDVWKCFLNNCKVSDIDLPNTNEKIHEVIKNATMYFNNRMRTSIQCDTSIETFSEELSEDSLLILANFIRLTFLVNQRTYFESLWQPFASDVGLRNFGTQINSLKASVQEQEKKLDILIINTMEDFL